MEIDRTLAAYLISLGLALILGAYIARTSAVQSRIHGGQAARVFHYLGAVGAAGSLPAALISLLMGLGLLPSLAKAFIFLVSGLAALVVFAAFERSALPAETGEDRGWTERDARRSDL